MEVHSFLSGFIVGTGTAVFANNAAINTAATDIVFPIPSTQFSRNEYMLTVVNPSTVTDLTVEIYAVDTDYNVDTFIASLNIPKAVAHANGKTVTSTANYIHGILNSYPVKFVVSNNVVLGASDGFTAKLKLQEVL